MRIFEFKNPTESKEISLLFKIVNIGIYCLFVLTLVFFFAMAISFITSKSKTGIPMFCNYAILTIASGSMVDYGFQIGDKVLVKKEPIESYKVGDFISFFDYEDPNCSNPSMVSENLVPRVKPRTSRMIFHEVIEIIIDSNGNKWFRTKGSNNKLPDGSLIYQNYVIGNYQSTSNSFNNLISFIFSLNGALVFVVLPCSMIICKESFNLANIIMDIKRRKVKTLKNKDDVIGKSKVQKHEYFVIKRKRRKRR